MPRGLAFCYAVRLNGHLEIYVLWLYAKHLIWYCAQERLYDWILFNIIYLESLYGFADDWVKLL